MGMFIAAALLTAFIVNVVLGSISGAPPLGNVSEMVLLLSAAIIFVIEILRREDRAAAQHDDHI